MHLLRKKTNKDFSCSLITMYVRIFFFFSIFVLTFALVFSSS